MMEQSYPSLYLHFSAEEIWKATLPISPPGLLYGKSLDETHKHTHIDPASLLQVQEVLHRNLSDELLLCLVATGQNRCKTTR